MRRSPADQDGWPHNRPSGTWPIASPICADLICEPRKQFRTVAEDAFDLAQHGSRRERYAARLFLDVLPCVDTRAVLLDRFDDRLAGAEVVLMRASLLASSQAAIPSGLGMAARSSASITDRSRLHRAAGPTNKRATPAKDIVIQQQGRMRPVNNSSKSQVALAHLRAELTDAPPI
jgi:hypothetical protein